MSKTAEIMVALLAKMPNFTRVSVNRLIFLVYLTDWVHSLRFGSPATELVWEYTSRGPYSWDVLETAEKSPEIFEVTEVKSPQGIANIAISLKRPKYERRHQQTATSVQIAVDHVIKEAGSLNWADFTQLVLSTHPVLTGCEYTALDLVKLAREYRDMNQLQLDPVTN